MSKQESPLSAWVEVSWPALGKKYYPLELFLTSRHVEEIKRTVPYQLVERPPAKDYLRAFHSSELGWLSEEHKAEFLSFYPGEPCP